MPWWHRKCQSFQSCHIKKTNKQFFWGNSSPCYTTHLCQPILNQSPKDKPLNFTSLGLRLSSHTSLFWTLPEQITPRICAHPSWTYLPKIHHKTSDPKIFISHICFELCRSSSPCYTTHVSQPVLYQCPKIHHKWLMTQFCKPIPIQPPKIHLSKFQCSPYRRQKCRALQEDTVEWKPVCDLQAKNGSQ